MQTIGSVTGILARTEAARASEWGGSMASAVSLASTVRRGAGLWIPRNLAWAAALAASQMRMRDSCRNCGGIDARLGHHVDGAGFERLHQRIRAGLGKAGADDDRDGALRHDLAQEGEPIHARHLDIEEHDIGHFLADALDRDIGIGGGGHDFEVGVARYDFAQRHAHGGAVVDDEDANLARWEVSRASGIGNPSRLLEYCRRDLAHGDRSADHGLRMAEDQITARS